MYGQSKTQVGIACLDVFWFGFFCLFFPKTMNLCIVNVLFHMAVHLFLMKGICYYNEQCGLFL